MRIIVEIPEGSSSGTAEIVGAAPIPPRDPVPEDHVRLPVTGHIVSMPVYGEGMMGYYQRVAESVGGRPDAAGSIQMFLGGEGAASLVAPELQGNREHWPLLVDAYANGVAYGIARNGGDFPGRGYAAEFPAEFPASGVLPWVSTHPNTPVCIKLPASTRGRPGDGVSMVLGGAAQAPLWVATGPSPIRTIAAIEAAVRAGQGVFGNGSTSRTPFVPGHYVSAFFEPQGHDVAQLLSGSAY